MDATDDHEGRLREAMFLMTQGERRSAAVTIRNPSMAIVEVSKLAGVGTSTTSIAVRKLRDSGWRRELGLENPGVTPDLLRDFPVERIVGKGKSSSCYGKWVMNREVGPHYNRLARAVVDRLKLLWPNYRLKGGRLGGVLAKCLDNMNHVELERFADYYMDMDAVAEYKYDFRGHEGSVYFTPLMVYPNLDPVVCEMLLAAEHNHNNWTFLSHLNSLDFVHQRRMITPPEHYKQYYVYAEPQNEYELAGFKEEQLADRDYLVKKSSPSGSDKRTKLLNCIRIIQRRFPRDESGGQELRRLTEGLISIAKSGDIKEIGIWKDALINAPTTPNLDLDLIPSTEGEADYPDAGEFEKILQEGDCSVGDEDIANDDPECGDWRHQIRS